MRLTTPLNSPLNATRTITLGDSAAGTGGTFDMLSASTGYYNGTLANASGGTNSLTKTGFGTLGLNGSSTYNGTTTVNQGTLLLNFSQSALPSVLSILTVPWSWAGIR